MSGRTLFEPKVGGGEVEVAAEEVVVGRSSLAAVGECGCSCCCSGVEWAELVAQAEEALGIVLAGGASGAEVGDGAATGVEAVMGAAG